MENNIVKFDETPGLGNVVSKITPFCKLMSDMPVPSYDYVVGVFADPKFHGLVGHKWSRICGFTFKSSTNTKHPYFQFVYVPKLRNRMTRNNAGLHGWYCWQYVSADTKLVMSINNVKSTYGFDINSFVFSDVFNDSIPVFIKNINTAVDD